MSLCKNVLLVSMVVFFMSGFPGCSNSIKKPAWLPALTPCKITIVQEGKPVAKANINIVAPPGELPLEYLIFGTTNEMGVVHPCVQVFKGVPKGEYVVTVEKIEYEMTNDINIPMIDYWVVDPKYASADTSTLKFSVGDSPVEQTFDLGKPVRVRRKN